MHPTSGDAKTWRHSRLTHDGYYERRWWEGRRPDRRQRSQREHRWVWEGHHGRKIPGGYDVHHADGDKRNNDPANLECLPKPVHDEHHAVRLRGVARGLRGPCSRCGRSVERKPGKWCGRCAREYARAYYHRHHPEAPYRRGWIKHEAEDVLADIAEAEAEAEAAAPTYSLNWDGED